MLKSGQASIYAFRDPNYGAWVKVKPDEASKIQQKISPMAAKEPSSKQQQLFQQVNLGRNNLTAKRRY